jgi:hypothetical protein
MLKLVLPLALYDRIQFEFRDRDSSPKKLTGAEPLAPLQ